MTEQTKVVFALAPLASETVIEVTGNLVSAITRFETSRLTLLETISETVSELNYKLTAQQWDKQVAVYIREGFAKKVKAGRIAESTASQYASKLKTAGLAILHGLKPVAGENLDTFCSRIAEQCSNLTLEDGTRVWPVNKTGRPAKAKGASAPKSGGAVGPSTGGDMPGATGGESGLNIRPALAAAMILAKQNRARAAALTIVLQSYAEQFDRFAAGLLTDKDKAELATMIGEAPKAEPAKAPPAPAKGPTDTAMGDAMVKAQAKVNAKASKAPKVTDKAA